jgi:hypothetical protein
LDVEIEKTMDIIKKKFYYNCRYKRFLIGLLKGKAVVGEIFDGLSDEVEVFGVVFYSLLRNLLLMRGTGEGHLMKS